MKSIRGLVPLLVAVGLVATACAGGSGGTGADVASVADLETAGEAEPLAAAEGLTSDPEADPAEVGVEQAMLDFAECMRASGVDLGDPTVDADGNLEFGRPGRLDPERRPDRGVMEAAREACAEHLAGVTLGFREQDRTVVEDAMVAYAACMRDNGYDMPDPDFSGVAPGQGGGGPFGAIDPDDPDFVAADAACRDVFTEAGLGDIPRPGFGPGRGGGE